MHHYSHLLPPWYALDWIQIVAAGTVGGFLSSFLPGGMNVPIPSDIRALIGDHKCWHVGGHMVINTVFGGLAGLALWAEYDPVASFSASGATPPEIVTAIIVGGAGVSIVNSLVHQHHEKVETAEDRNEYREAYDLTLEALDESQVTGQQLEARVAELTQELETLKKQKGA